MSTVRFRMEVCSVRLGAKPHWETYEVDAPKGETPLASALHEGERLINYFNSTLRPGESKRQLLRAEVLDENPQEHKWFKVTAMTQSRRIGLGTQLYDVMKCERCGILGKRMNLNRGVKLDSGFRAQFWKRCDLAAAAFAAGKGPKARDDE